MIKPTVGRQVWYRPRAEERTHLHDQPFAATVLHVWSDSCVNLQILNERGEPINKTSVILAQDRPAQPGECEWMPYQIGKAKADAHPLHAGIVPIDTPATPHV